MVARNKLSGQAAAWLSNVGGATPLHAQTYSSLGLELQSQFGANQSTEEVVKKLMSRAKLPSESYYAYATALRTIGVGTRVSESFFVTAFTTGVDWNTAGVLRMDRPATLMAAAKRAAELRGSDGVQRSRVNGFASGAAKVMSAAAERGRDDPSPPAHSGRSRGYSSAGTAASSRPKMKQRIGRLFCLRRDRTLGDELREERYRTRVPKKRVEDVHSDHARPPISRPNTRSSGATRNPCRAISLEGAHSATRAARDDQRTSSGEEPVDHAAVATASVCLVAADGLPTAVVYVRVQARSLKIGTCARYTIAGEQMKKFGVKLQRAAAVDAVEGIGGGVLKVEGVWRFKVRASRSQDFELDALVVAGCDGEFLLGGDFIVSRKGVVNFATFEFTCNHGMLTLRLPFTCSDAGDSPRRCAVKLMRRHKLRNEFRHDVQLSVDSPEGTVGVFILVTLRESHLLLAPTVTVVRGGRVCVPILSVRGARTKLPRATELGHWIPVTGLLC